MPALCGLRHDATHAVGGPTGRACTRRHATARTRRRAADVVCQIEQTRDPRRGMADPKLSTARALATRSRTRARFVARTSRSLPPTSRARVRSMRFTAARAHVPSPASPISDVHGTRGCGCPKRPTVERTHHAFWRRIASYYLARARSSDSASPRRPPAAPYCLSSATLPMTTDRVAPVGGTTANLTFRRHPRCRPRRLRSARKEGRVAATLALARPCRRGSIQHARVSLLHVQIGAARTQAVLFSARRTPRDWPVVERLLG